MCPDAIDGPAGCDPLLDVSDHTGGLSVIHSLFDGAADNLAEIYFKSSEIGILIIVDIQLASWISLTSSLECDADKVFAEHIRENGASEASILVEHLVDNILILSAIDFTTRRNVVRLARLVIQRTH